MTQPPDALRLTPLHQLHADAGARLAPFAGWQMPLAYEGQLAEHEAVRRAAGVFDVSHMGQVEISGPGAEAFLQYVLPADVSRLREGKSRYTVLLNESGGILDDLIVTRTGPDRFFAVVNAATREMDVAWLRARAHQFPGALVHDVSDRWAMIAAQGPRALGILDQVLPGDSPWSETAPFTFHRVGGVIFSRTGYTGEQGGEILCPPALAVDFWGKLVAAGCVPCGLAARDSLRLEAGYLLYGNDMTEETTPLQAGLSWTIAWKKEANFIGREALLREKAEGPARRLIPLESAGRKPLRRGDAVLHQGSEVGAVTSGGYSPGLQKGIALALVAGDAAEAAHFQVKSGRSELPCVRTRLPFVPIGLKA